MLMIIFIFFLFLNFSNCILDQFLIKDYINSKHTHLGSVFGCSSKREYGELLKYLSNYGARISFFNIKKIHFPIEEILYKDYYHLFVIVDGDCAGIDLILTESGKKHLFTDDRHWLIISKYHGTLTGILQRVNFNINTDVNVVVPNFNENEEIDHWIIYDVYNTASLHNGEFHSNILGYYSIKTGYQAASRENKHWRRRNMTGAVFTSAIVIPNKITVPLDQYLNNQETRQNNSLNRFQSMTVNNCRDFFNFTLKVRRTNSWGYIQNKTGKFNGLVSLLERKVVDFGSSPLLYKKDRMPVVGYSFGNWILRSAFIYRAPKSTLSSFEIFLRPLSYYVWANVIAVTIFIIIFLKIIVMMEAKLENFLKGTFESTWSAILIFVIAAYCQQGSPYIPTLISGRILSITLLVLGFIIYQFYAGCIVSYLLMDPPKSINTLEDLLNSDLKVGIEDILIDRDYFVQTTDPIAKSLYRNKICKNNKSEFLSPNVGLELVKKGRYAFHVEVSTAYPIVRKTFSSKVICELQEIQMYNTQPMHTSLQKNSPFIETFNYCMLRQVENGVMCRLRHYWSAQKPECIESNHQLAVGIDELACSFMVLCFGMLLSLLMLVAEILYKKYSNTVVLRKKNKTCIFLQQFQYRKLLWERKNLKRFAQNQINHLENKMQGKEEIENDVPLFPYIN